MVFVKPLSITVRNLCVAELIYAQNHSQPKPNRAWNFACKRSRTYPLHSIVTRSIVPAISLRSEPLYCALVNIIKSGKYQPHILHNTPHCTQTILSPVVIVVCLCIYHHNVGTKYHKPNHFRWHLYYLQSIIRVNANAPPCQRWRKCHRCGLRKYTQTTRLHFRSSEHTISTTSTWCENNVAIRQATATAASRQKYCGHFS